MKKFIVIVLIIITTTGITIAKPGFYPGQNMTHTFRFGVYGPADAKPGITLGYNYGKAVDEMVSIGIGGDLYVKNYIKETTVATDSIFSGQIVTIRRELDFSSYLLPIHGNVMISFPTAIAGFEPFLSGGLGISFLRNSEVNYLTDEKDNRFFASFSWNLGTGVKYRLGSSSSFLMELVYHNALLKSNEDRTEAGLPVYEQIDMSGFGIRVGLALEL